jgi:3-oxoacyl-[acyl-carrier-protein] synthase II
MAWNNRDVVVTGVGPVTALGCGADVVWPALAAGRTAVSRRTFVVDAGRVAEVLISAMPEAAAVPGLPAQLEFLAANECADHRDLAYALLAADFAIRDAGLEYDRENNRIGAVQAFEAPGAEAIVGGLLGMLSTPPPPNGPPPMYDMLAPHFYNAQPFVYVHLVGKALGLHGFSTSVHNACASGAIAFDVAAQQIRCGRADAMIVLGGEAFSTGVRMEWFRRLDLYAKDEKLRPFDRQSGGFFLGEGGAALVLESAEHARKRGAKPYARYAGGAFAQQSWKHVLPDVPAGRLGGVISSALFEADVPADQLDLIVPHGAGMRVSDGYEAACLRDALGEKPGRAVATAFKPYFGHLLAASVVVEVAALLMAMRNGVVPAALNTDPATADLPVPLVSKATPRTIRHAMKLATGFTGHDAALVFSTPA